MTEQEYNETVDKLADNLYRYALRCCGSKEYADDAVQESFAALWENRDSVKDVDEARKYLFVVSKHKILDRWRHDKIEQQYSEGVMVSGDDSYDPVGNMDLQDAIEKAMAMLTLEQRTLLTLHDIEGYDYKEIAEMNGDNYVKVQVSAFRARIKLKETLKKMNVEF